MEYMISIDGTAVEDEVADNMYQRLEWDWTIYSKQLEHVQLYRCRQELCANLFAGSG